jgi:aquaporin Z
MNSKAFFSEVIGTFALTFVGAGAAAISGNLVAIALAHGLVVLTFAFAYGHHSGAHINPAVTFGLWVAGEIEFGKTIVYWIAQALGGVIGGALLYFVLGGAESGLGATVLADNVLPTQGLVLEAVLTFLFVNTIMNTAVSGKAGNLAPIPIGLTFAFCILMGHALTGASLNPARTLGPAIFSGTMDLFWLYVVGTFIGAALAGLLYRGFLKDD